MRRILDYDTLLNVRSYGHDVKYFIDDSDTYLKLQQVRNGFDQWQFYYDLLQFSRVISEYLPFLKQYKQYFVDYYKKGQSIQKLNTIMRKVRSQDYNTFSTIVNYIIPLHPYSDYTIIGLGIINNLPYKVGEARKYQEYDEELWQVKIWDIVKEHKDIMPYIYKGIKPLDYLLNKWLSISSDIEYTERTLNPDLDKIRKSMKGSNVKTIPGLTLDSRSTRGLAYMLHNLDRMPYVTKGVFTPLPHDLLD